MADSTHLADEEAPLQSSTSDPFTGTRPVGPVQTGDPKAGRGNWGVAARWFVFALLAILLLLSLQWFL